MNTKAIIDISSEQYKEAVKIIGKWFPGTENKAARKVFREQLSEQVSRINGQEYDHRDFWNHELKVKVGYGILFLHGSGDQRTQNFNEDVNKVLGLPPQ